MARTFRKTIPVAILVTGVLIAAAAGCGSDREIEADEPKGTSTMNIPLDRRDKLVALRWVPSHDGELVRMYLRVKVEGSDECPYADRPGYAAGSTGRMLATTHPLTADGNPDMGEVLSRDEFVPCEREDGESVAIDTGIDVRIGQTRAVVVRNVDPAPAKNWFSLNFLIGEADESLPFPGRDPRESVAVSVDGGSTWRSPDPNLVPTYIQEYAGPRRTGQPYYYSLPARGELTMVYPRAPRPLTIGAVGAWTFAPGAAPVTLAVDGRERASVVLGGTGLVRAEIPPVVVPDGGTVTLTTRTGPGGLSLRVLHADMVWARLMGLGRGFSRYLEQRPRDVVSLFPIEVD